MLSTLLFAFGAGAVSTANPCGFAFLPIYFTHRLGSAAEVGGSGAATALAAGSLATIAFVAVFGVIGLIISLGAHALVDALPWAGFAIGIVLVAVGAYVASGRQLRLSLPVAYPIGGESGLRSDFMFGLAYGTASLSCTLPVFLAVTGLAVTGNVLGSTLSFVAFAVGMGTVLTAIAVAAAVSRKGLERSVRRFLPYAYRFGGVMLLLAGAYVVYYWGSVLFSPDLPSLTGVIGVGERVSGWARRWIGDEAARPVLLGLFGFFALLGAWAVWRHKPSHAAIDDNKGDETP